MVASIAPSFNAAQPVYAEDSEEYLHGYTYTEEFENAKAEGILEKWGNIQ